MKYTWLIMFCAIPVLCRSQKNTIDSLKKRLSFLQDSGKVICLNKISLAYYINALPQTYNYVQTDSARLFALEAYDIANKIHYINGIADALQNLGEIARDRGEYQTAENYIRKAVKIFEKIKAAGKFSWSALTLGWSLHVQCKFLEAKAAYEKAMPYYLSTGDKEKQAMLYRLISYTYSARGYNEKAFENMLKAIRITREISDFRGSVSSPLNMGVLYQDAGETQTALFYYQLAAQNAKTKRQPVRYNIIKGDISALQNKPDSAIYYYEQSLHIVDSLTTDSSMRKKESMIQSVKIGELYLGQKEYDKAIEHFHEPLIFFEKGNDQGRTLNVLHKIAVAYEMKQMFSKSFIYAKRLLNMAQATAARPFIRDGFELYWKIYDTQKKTDSAYQYHLKYIAIKDSILKDEYLRNIALSEMKDKDDQQTAEINLLQKSQLIHQQQLRLQQQQLKSETLIRNVLIGSILFVLTLGIFIFRTISLKRKNESLESERAQAELRQKATDLEMQALRSQMNPHFIFNCLSSINRFILTNKTEEASDYLTKFSRLIRMALHNSEKSFITLEDEIEVLRLYLDLERLRCKNSFDYNITFCNTIELSSVFIPAMLVQPFVENAIWHGLQGKNDGNGKISIHMDIQDNILQCTICDNGIGRSASVIKKDTDITKRSLGINLTQRRLQLIDPLKQHETSIEFHDIKIDSEQTSGTRVHIKIPVSYTS